MTERTITFNKATTDRFNCTYRGLTTGSMLFKDRSIDDRRRERKILRALEAVSMPSLDRDTGRPLGYPETGEPARVLKSDDSCTVTLLQEDLTHLIKRMESAAVHTPLTVSADILDAAEWLEMYASKPADPQTPPSE